MQTGVRLSCNPPSELRHTLAQWMGCQRFIYTAKVVEDRYFRTFQRKTLSLTGVYPPSDQQYSQFKDKELTPWLYEVPSEILRNGTVRYQQALSRFHQGLAGRPKPKKKSSRQSVWLTSELFRFEPHPDGGHRLILGKGKKHWGEIPFTAHAPYQIPNAIVVSRQGGKWFVSFSYEDGIPEPNEADIIAHYAAMTQAELEAISEGYDRGVKVPFMSGEGTASDFTPEQKAHLIKLDQHRKKYERRMARCTKGSNRHRKMAGRIACQHAKAANIRREFAHQESYRMAESPIEVFIGESLKVQNMVAKTKPQPLLHKDGSPKRDQHGNIRYQKNGRKAKSGLARSILASCWGQSWTYLQYKARRRNKLTIKVSPYQSSQECAECGHTHPDNRLTQSEFRCTNCGHADNADHNAARVIKKRGIIALLKGEIKAPKRKKTMRMAKKNQVGLEESEPAGVIPLKLDSVATPEPSAPSTEETQIRHEADNICPVHRSVKRESPATTPHLGA